MVTIYNNFCSKESLFVWQFSQKIYKICYVVKHYNHNKKGNKVSIKNVSNLMGDLVVLSLTLH